MIEAKKREAAMNDEVPLLTVCEHKIQLSNPVGGTKPKSLSYRPC